MIIFQTLSHCHKRMPHPISKLKLTGKDKRKRQKWTKNDKCA